MRIQCVHSYKILTIAGDTLSGDVTSKANYKYNTKNTKYKKTQIIKLNNKIYYR